jgi:hypothetical protein
VPSTKRDSGALDTGVAGVLETGVGVVVTGLRIPVI